MTFDTASRTVAATLLIVMALFAGEVAAQTPHACVREHYAPGAGAPPNACPPDREHEAGKCVKKCPADAPKRVGNVCIGSAGKSVDTGQPTLPICPTGHEKIGGLCHPMCKSGFERVALNCLQSCPAAMPHVCGSMCTTDRASCSPAETKQPPAQAAAAAAKPVSCGFISR